MQAQDLHAGDGWETIIQIIVALHYNIHVDVP
jgi:hypothetical protein